MSKMKRFPALLALIWLLVMTGIASAVLPISDLAALKPTAQATPNMTIHVGAAANYVGASLIQYAGGNSPTMTAPTSNPRRDLVTLNGSGAIVIVTGTEGGSPSIPTIPTDKTPIALIYHRVGETSIQPYNKSDGNGYIERDIRPFLSWAPPSASVPWGGITGTLANQTDLNSALAGKQATITAGTITFAEMANLAAYSLIGNNTASSATPLALTADLTLDLLAGQGTHFNGTSQILKLNGSGQLPALDGSLLTNLPSGFANPMTTLGDIIYGGASGVAARLTGNTSTTNNFLRSVGSGSAATAPTWATISKTDVGLANVTNEAQIAKSIGTTKGDLITFSAANTPVRMPAGATPGFLYTDGSENWSISSTTASAAGSDTQVQVNNGGAMGYCAGLTYNQTTGATTSTAQTAAAVPLTAKGTGSQTGDLFQALDSSSNVLARISKTGSLAIGSGAVQTYGVEVYGPDSASASARLWRTVNSGAGPGLALFKDRTGSIAPTANDQCGAVTWYGFDGANYQNIARIFGCIGPTPGSGDMPGYIRFDVTPEGSSTAAEALRINQDGTLTSAATYSNSVSGRDVYVGSAGSIGYYSSSRKFKEDIKPVDDISWLFADGLTPRKYDRKDGSEKGEIGLIAEDVATVPGIPSNLVSYKRIETTKPNAEGFVEQRTFVDSTEPETVNYSRLITPLLAAVRELKTANDALTVRVTALEKQVAELEPGKKAVSDPGAAGKSIP
jgi:hypothetical protein